MAFGLGLPTQAAVPVLAYELTLEASTAPMAYVAPLGGGTRLERVPSITTPMKAAAPVMDAAPCDAWWGAVPKRDGDPRFDGVPAISVRAIANCSHSDW